MARGWSIRIPFWFIVPSAWTTTADFSNVNILVVLSMPLTSLVGLSSSLLHLLSHGTPLVIPSMALVVSGTSRHPQHAPHCVPRRYQCVTYPPQYTSSVPGFRPRYITLALAMLDASVIPDPFRQLSFAAPIPTASGS